MNSKINKYIEMRNESFCKLENSIMKKGSIIYIGDKFTKVNLESIFNVIDIEIFDIFLFEKLLECENKIEFLFIESCWFGKNNTWRSKVNSTSEELLYLIGLFKKNNIKIIFFNKEDPVYFDAFKNTSKYVDIIITTSSEKVLEYKKINPSATVLNEQYFLNHLEYNMSKFDISKEKEEIFFAGSYYPRYVERTQFIDENFDTINDEFKLSIYDRNAFINNSVHHFPISLKKYIVGGGLTSEQLNDATINFKYAINLNSIIDSNTMLARRVFEQVALGKIQISNFSEAMKSVEKYPVFYNQENDIKKIIFDIKQKNYSVQERFKASIDVLIEKSTYSVFSKIKNKLDIRNDSDKYIFVKINEITDISKLISNYIKQSFTSGNTILIETTLKNRDFIKDSIKLFIDVEVEFFDDILDVEKNIIIFDIDTKYNSDYFITSKLCLDIFDSIDSFNFETKSENLIMYKSTQKGCVFRNINALKMSEVYSINLEMVLGKYIDSVIVISNVYPSAENIYRNGFIHTRLKAYEDNNINAIMMTYNENQEYSTYSYESIGVFNMTLDKISQFSSINNVNKIFVHFLTPTIKNILENSFSSSNKYIWIHGVEALSYKRRKFQYDFNDKKQVKEFKKYKNSNIKLFDMWQEVLDDKSYKYIFVSKWMRDIFEEDMNPEGKNYTYDIIANPINIDLFKYSKKDFSKLRVLSIRPYASAKYANDQVVNAILHLSEKSFFKDIEFTLIGDGVLFDSILKPLVEKKFTNVTIQKSFVKHEDIRKMHEKNNVFLCPTRQDSQGVSMCEAMASGLVIVSSNNTAIPNFVPEGCGLLAEEENFIDLADKIEYLYNNKIEANLLSKNGSKFISNICNINNIVKDEINIGKE